jgi:hypothetical protein
MRSPGGLRKAHFPKVKMLEEFAFCDAPHIPAALVRNLAEGGYLSRSEPISQLRDLLFAGNNSRTQRRRVEANGDCSRQVLQWPLRQQPEYGILRGVTQTQTFD